MGNLMFLRCEVVLRVRFSFSLFSHHRLHRRPHCIALAFASLTSLWLTSGGGGALQRHVARLPVPGAGPSDVTTPPGQLGGLLPVLANERNDEGACTEGRPVWRRRSSGRSHALALDQSACSGWGDHDSANPGPRRERAELRGGTPPPPPPRGGGKKRAVGAPPWAAGGPGGGGGGGAGAPPPPPRRSGGDKNSAVCARTLAFVQFWDRRGLCTVRSPGVLFWVRRILHIVLRHFRARFSGPPGRAQIRERVCGRRVFSRQPTPCQLHKLG
uniref:Uncharacterized protein n=1 Tax=Eptatretus burgeri TaxID=7764 RepID=A0A8C4N3M7_EPTBU